MPELLTLKIGELLDQMADRFPEHEALIDPRRGVRYTFEQFRNITNRVARGLLAIGVKKGDKVAMWSTNYPEWIITQFATAKMGAILVTVNTNYKKFELEYLLKQSDSTTLILCSGVKDSDYVQHIGELCPTLAASKPGMLSCAKLPFLKNIIFLDQSTPAGMYSYSDLYRLADQVSEEELFNVRSTLNKDDVINMQYTSGTTGFPKGVMLTHYNLVNNGRGIGDCMKLTENDRLLIHVPLFHCFGCVLGVMACMTHGTTIVLNDHFNPVQALEIIEAERCTAVHGVPTMFIAMLDHPDFKKHDLSSLRTGIMAGSPCPIEIMKRAVGEMGMREITISYGQTESSPVVTMTTTDDPIEVRVSTVGKCMPNMEVKIVDMNTGEDVAPGTTGEIVTRGYQVMKGYYKMPEATANAIDESGWLHTGDLGMMDEAGYFKITGRLKDMIIRGGENIYPREIEEFLYTHPKVKDVQVVGVPDEKYGEEVLACVILREGAAATEQEMIEYVRSGLSRFKTPRYVRFVETFPMTASGKIQKHKMREWAVDELNLHKAASIETA